MPRPEAAAPLLWWRPTAATFVVAIVAMNRVDVVDLVVDLVDVDLDVDLVDVDLDVDLVDVDLDVVPFCGCCPAGGLDLEKSSFFVFCLDLSLGTMLDSLVLKNAVECTSQRLKWTSGARVMTIFGFKKKLFHYFCAEN